MSTIYPASTQQGQPKTREWLPTLKSHLSRVFGLTLFVVFGVALAIVAGLIFGVRNEFLSDFRASLKKQVKANAKASIEDSGNVVEFKMMEGISGALLPNSFTWIDSTQRCTSCGQYSLPPLPSCVETKNTSFQPRCDPQEFDERFPNDLIDRSHSAVYFYNQISTGVATPWQNYAGTVNSTSWMDWWAPEFWTRDQGWRAIYSGTETGMFRFFPGLISTREEDNYNARTRPWYSPAPTRYQTVASSTRNPLWQPAQDLLTPIYHTEPYLSFSTNSWIITLSKAVYHPTPCLYAGLPECRGVTSLLGVSAVDMLVSTVRDVVIRLRSGKLGQAHLFVTASGVVVASPQWVPSSSDSTTHRMTQIKVVTQTFSTEILSKMKSQTSGQNEFDGAVISHLQIINGLYTICLTSVVDEIVEPVTKKENEINSAAATLMLICTGIAMGVFVVVGFLFYRTISAISGSLAQTAKDSNTISERIGGELFDSTEPEDVAEQCCCFSSPKEVWQLRHSFVEMLRGVRQLRETKGGLSETPNPFFERNDILEASSALNDERLTTKLSSCLDPCDLSAEPTAKQTTSTNTDTNKQSKSKATTQSDNTPPRLQTMKQVLLFRVAVPIVLGFALVLVAASVGVSVSTSDWTPSVRDQITVEETANLLVRTETLRDLTNSVLQRAATSALQFKDYTEMVWNAGNGMGFNGLNLTKDGKPYTIYHERNAPGGVAPWTNTPEGGITTSARFPSLSAWNCNYKFMVFYSNARSGPSGQSGYQAPFSSSKWPQVVQQQTLLSHVDNAARAIYFSNEMILQIYVGLEDTESFRIFPYRDLSAYYTTTYDCVANNQRIVSYNPKCRPWYQLAVENRGNITFNPLSISASTGQAVLGVGYALYDRNGTLFGVANLDLNINVLRDTISNMKLYDNGYTYLMDNNGFVVIHRSASITSSSASQLVTDLEFVCSSGKTDTANKQTFEAEILPRMQHETQDPNVVLKYERCHQTWLLVWRPVNNTPYIFVATVPESDIVAPADDFEDQLHNTLVGYEVGFAFLWVACIVVCVFVVNRISVQVAHPVSILSNFVAQMQPKKFVADFPEDMSAEFRELQDIRLGISDLLTALRFGNPSFAQGSRAKEIKNYIRAKAIVERNEFPRGRGIVYNNLGNTLRQYEVESGVAAVREFDELLNGLDAEKLLRMSVESMRDLVRQENHASDVTTLGQRVFNLGLLYLARSQQGAADFSFNEALTLVKQNADVLARFAYTLCLTPSSQQQQHHHHQHAPQPSAPTLANAPSVDDMPPLDYTTAKFVLLFADAALGPDSGPISAGSLAMVCFALGVAHNNPLYFVWALGNLRALTLFHLGRLAAYAKAGNPQFVDVVDPTMSEVESMKWVRGFVLPEKAFSIALPGTNASAFFAKTLVFCLDTSGSMAGSALTQCKQALTSISNDNCNDDDTIGLITFSGNVVVCQQPNRKRNCLGSMLAQVDGMQAGGGTAFFSGLRESLNLLKSAPADGPKWLVALTDGDDNQSRPDDFDIVCNMLRNALTTVNFVVIMVGQQFTHTTNTRIEKLLHSAKEVGSKAERVAASNIQEIRSAFDTVVALMDDSLMVTEFL